MARPIKKLLVTFGDLTTLTNLIGYYYEIWNLGSSHAVAPAIREKLVKELSEDLYAGMIKKMGFLKGVSEWFLGKTNNDVHKFIRALICCPL